MVAALPIAVTDSCEVFVASRACGLADGAGRMQPPQRSDADIIVDNALRDQLGEARLGPGTGTGQLLLIGVDDGDFVPCGCCQLSDPGAHDPGADDGHPCYLALNFHGDRLTVLST